MHIQLATKSDAAVLATLAAQTFKETFDHYEKQDLDSHLAKTCSEEFFIKALANGNIIILAYVNGKPVGYAKVGKVGLLDVFPDTSCEIHRLYVLKACHGQGIGSALMQYLISMPIIQKAPHIYIGVWENNPKAQKFYSHYGFEAVGEYKYYVGKHVDREIIMVKKPV